MSTNYIFQRKLLYFRYNRQIFYIPNLLPALPETKLQSSVPLEYTDNVQHYINSIMDTGASKIMIVLSGGSAHQIPDSTGSGVIIKKQGSNCSPTKIAEAVKCMGSSYHRELEAVATDYARDNLSPSYTSIYFLSVSNIKHNVL